MEEGNFYLINEPDIPTFFQYRKTNKSIYGSVLDLAFATGDLFDWTTRWSICDTDIQETGSYHEMIRFEIMHNGTLVVPSPLSHRYNWKKADWKLFTSLLQTSTTMHTQLWTTLMATQHRHESLDQAAETLRDLILEAVTSSVPRLHVHARSKAWWTQEITDKRKKMRGAKRQHKAAPSEENHFYYKRTRNEYFRSIKQSKTDKWNTYVEEAKGSKVYDPLKQLKPRRTQKTPAIRHNGVEATTFRDKAELLRSVMFFA